MYKKLFIYVVLGISLHVSSVSAIEEGVDSSEQLDRRFPKAFAVEMTAVPFLLSGIVGYVTYQILHQSSDVPDEALIISTFAFCTISSLCYYLRRAQKAGYAESFVAKAGMGAGLSALAGYSSGGLAAILNQ